MHKNIYYPWLSIWLNPRKTIHYLSQKSPLWTIVLLFVLSVILNADNFTEWSYANAMSLLSKGFLVLIAYVAIVYIFTLLFSGKATKKEILLITLLPNIPFLLQFGLSIFTPLYEIPYLYYILSVPLTLWYFVVLSILIQEVQKLSRLKTTFMIIFVILSFLLVTFFLLRSLNSDVEPKWSAKEYTQFMKDESLSEETPANLAIEAKTGYVSFYNKKEAFLAYNKEMLTLFNPDIEQRDSLLKNTNAWVNTLGQGNLSSSDLSGFIEQLETIDGLDKDKNTTWGNLAKKLPDIYIGFMTHQLTDLLKSDRTVEIIDMYDENASLIQDYAHSKSYLVSEVYLEISDFCDDAKDSRCATEHYAEKAAKISPLNPAALFMYAYHNEDKLENIVLLEKVLALTKRNDDLLDYSSYAIYNNLGFFIYGAKLKEKYNDALRYLEHAYALEPDAVYALATIASIHMDSNQSKLAYDALAKEAHHFLKANTSTLKNKDSNYWIFVRKLISVSYAVDDFNTTKYVCEKYLEIKDAKYEICQTYLNEIEGLKQLPTPKFTLPQTDTQIITCGTVQSYGESLKSRMNTGSQKNLLGKFTKLYAPLKVPPTLKELIKFEEKMGSDSYAISFYLRAESRKKFFYYAFSGDDTVNAKLAESFLPLANIDGTGGSIAFWIKDITDLENAPLVEFGSEGHIGIVAKNIKDFLFMLSLGKESSDGEYTQYISTDEDFYRRAGFQTYRTWLKETMKIEPLKNWKSESLPEIEKLQKEANTLYKKPFFKWLYTYIPDPEVEQAAYDKKQSIKYTQEKKRLLTLLETNNTSETYVRLANNEKQLMYLDKAERKDVIAYYKKALTLATDKTPILFKLAKMHSGEKALAYYKEIEKTDPDPAKTGVYDRIAFKYYLDEKYKESYAYYKKDLLLNPKKHSYASPYFKKVCEALGLNQIEQYEILSQTAINPLIPDILHDLYMKDGQLDKAMKSLERLFKVAVLKEFEYAVYGGAFFDKGKNAYAIRVYEEGTEKIENYKDKAYLHTKLVKVYQKEKNRKKIKEHQKEAIKFYIKALESQKEESRKLKIYTTISDLYEELHEYENAIVYLKKSVSLEKDEKEQSNYLYYIAKDYQKLGKFQDALDFAKKSLRLTPQDKDSLAQVAALEKLNVKP